MQKLQPILFLLTILLGVTCARAQYKLPGQSDKLPPGIGIADVKSADSILVVTTTAVELKSYRLLQKKDARFIYHASVTGISLDSLLAASSVIFIQPVRRAHDEMVMNISDMGLNGVYYAYRQFPNITGKGITAALKEQRPDTADIDFRLRFTQSGREDATLSAHATSMATLMLGGGNSYYTGKGVAFKSNFISTSYNILMPEPDSIYRKYKVSVQNHSYGTGIENFYGADSYAYDASVNTNDSLLHVFSAGNSGNLTSNAGRYAGITGFANLTGSFKQTKNSISAGATDSLNNVEALSSRGPAYDGRIKPELVAFGQDGSSGAAATVSGAALLVQDAYKQKNNVLPSSALVKAVLINGADDLVQPGPDYIAGFGALNTERAVRHIVHNQYFTGTVSNGVPALFNISIPAGSSELKITLSWNDIAAAPNAVKALVNDLDLELVANGSGTVYYPLVLSSFAHADSLRAVAVQKTDTLNTTEQVVLSAPPAGNYTIRIKGTKVTGSQFFAIAYNWQQQNEFYFTYPGKNDNLLSGSRNTIRWQSFTPPNTNALLEISYNAGNTWQVLGNSVALSNKYFQANIKDTATLARLRMSYNAGAGNTVITSDTFTISPRPEINVSYYCADSVQLYWSKTRNASGYDVYALTDTFMRFQAQVADTAITLPVTSYKHYAVAPLVNNKTMLRSYGIDFSQQGIGCFINSFYADPVGDSVVNLKAILGSRYQVQQLLFERLYPVTQVSSFTVNRDTFTSTDRINKAGIYYYRAKIILTNGRILFSDTVQVIIYKEQSLYVYPNPYINGTTLFLETQDIGTWYFDLINTSGQRVFSRRMRNSNMSLVLPVLSNGLYFYRIVQSTGNILTGKLIIQ